MVDLRQLDPTKANLDHEKSRIRLVNVNDPEEKKRLWEIETDSLVAKFVENLSRTEAGMVKSMASEQDYLVLAVEGKSGHVEEAEVGKLQGWIAIYNEEKERLARLAEEGLADLLSTGKRIFEIGFARHPKAKSGQMASALRQALRLLCEEHRKDGAYELVVTAYIDDANEASLRVLEAAGFVRKGKVKYHLESKSYDHFFVWQK